MPPTLIINITTFTFPFIEFAGVVIFFVRWLAASGARTLDPFELVGRVGDAMVAHSGGAWTQVVSCAANSLTICKFVSFSLVADPLHSL